MLAGYRVGGEYEAAAKAAQADWQAEVERVCAAGLPAEALEGRSPGLPAEAPEGRRRVTQAQIIGVLQDALGPTDVIVCAAGSLPGDLHKLWRARDPKGYHLEYGYSCMGYEIAGGLGVKMAAPERDVYVLVGDGSYLMMAQEIVTAVQERLAMTIVLLDNRGFASIGGLSEAVGSGGFGTQYRYRNPATGDLDGDALPVDLAANAESLGARVWRAGTLESRPRTRSPRHAQSNGHPSSSFPSSARLASPATTRGGTSRSPRCRAAAMCRRRERRTRSRARGSATFCDPGRKCPLFMGRARIRNDGDHSSCGAGARRNGGGRLRRHRVGRLGVSPDRTASARGGNGTARSRPCRGIRSGRVVARGRD